MSTSYGLPVRQVLKRLPIFVFQTRKPTRMVTSLENKQINKIDLTFAVIESRVWSIFCRHTRSDYINRTGQQLGRQVMLGTVREVLLLVLFRKNPK